MAESVERLKAATKRSVFSSMAEQSAVGTVKESRVSLQRVIPMVGNSFKPFFVGRFIYRNGQVILAGGFTMQWMVKIFMTFWFGGIAGFTVVSLFAVGHPLQKATMFPLFGIGMFAAGAGVVWLGKAFAQNDAAWLSSVISGALRAQNLNPPVQPDAVMPGIYSSQRSSPAMTVASIVLAAMGLSCGWLAITGIQSMHPSHQGTVITYFQNPMLRYFAAAFATMMLTLAYRIYRRRLIAWRGGLFFLGLSWAYSMIEMPLAEGMPKNTGFMIFFGVATLIVTVIWGNWWYAQRIHFHE